MNSSHTDRGSKDAAKGNAAYRSAARRNGIPTYDLHVKCKSRFIMTSQTLKSALDNLLMA